MGLLGNAGLNAPLYVYVSRWFDRRRGSALALISSGGYLAGFVWPTIFERSIAYFGWRWTMIGFAVLQIAVIVPLAIIFLRPPPELPARAPLPRARRRASRRCSAGMPTSCSRMIALRGVPVLRDHVDAAAASGRVLQRPRHLGDGRRGHAVGAARHGLLQPPGLGLAVGPDRRPAHRAAQLGPAMRGDERLPVHPGRGRPVRGVDRVRHRLQRADPGLCADHPRALSDQRGALAGADAAAAQRQRHGDRRLARRLSLRHLRLLHAGLRHRRRLQRRQYRDPVHAGGAAAHLYARPRADALSARETHHQHLLSCRHSPAHRCTLRARRSS